MPQGKPGWGNGWCGWMGVLCGCLFSWLACGWIHAQTIVYSTGFEPEEGFTAESSLTGQDGWTGDGADGVLTNFFEGFGQQAYIGFAPPRGETRDFYSVYRPVNLAQIPHGRPVVRFSVMMQVVDSGSTNGPWDNFRWSVYNTAGVRLFSLDFDNASLEVTYLLDDGTGFTATGLKFDNQGYYDLEIVMNFARNLWTASLNDEVVVNSKPISAAGNTLNLGDIGAVWSVRYPSFPGENYMLFDEYSIESEPADSIPARLESLGVQSGGTYHARLYAEPGLPYRIEASNDLVHWTPLLTVTAPPGGVLDFRDSTAATFGQRFYRARQGTQ